MATQRGDLGAAHRGYAYQDIATAYFMGERLAERHGSVMVDRKVVYDDRFDDLTVQSSRGTLRRQFKHADSRERAFQVSDITTDSSRIRIDRLIRTFQLHGHATEDEYRVCATWLAPGESEVLLWLKEDSTSPPSFPGHQTRMFRLSPLAIWPAGGGICMDGMTESQRSESEVGGQNRYKNYACGLARRPDL